MPRQGTQWRRVSLCRHLFGQTPSRVPSARHKATTLHQSPRQPSPPIQRCTYARCNRVTSAVLPSFVKMSEGFSVPGTFSRRLRPLLNTSCTHKTRAQHAECDPRSKLLKARLGVEHQHKLQPEVAGKGMHSEAVRRCAHAGNILCPAARGRHRSLRVPNQCLIANPHV